MGCLHAWGRPQAAAATPSGRQLSELAAQGEVRGRGAAPRPIECRRSRLLLALMCRLSRAR